MSLRQIITWPFAWLMRTFIGLTGSYGLSLILFSLVVNLVLMPFMAKSKRSMMRTTRLQPKIQELQRRHEGNPQKLQAEMNKLYQEEGINQTAGCLGSILTMVLLLGVYQVVMRPLTFVLRLVPDQITEAKNLLVNWLEAQHITEKYINGRPELIILKYAKTNPEIFSSMSGFTDKLSGFNNNFLGFDLAGVPSLHPENGWSFTAIMLVLLPVLATIAQLVMTVITQAHSKKTNPAAAQQMGGMNLMLYLSPLMTLWIGMSVPAGMSFYWLVNSVISLIVQLLLYKYLSGERLVKINEREKQKQIAKGPTWMQRMMEQSAQMQAQQNGTGAAGTGNRTRYADGDDGMSRKERAEYEKTLIEAARKRAALKYGDDVPAEQSSDQD